MVTAALRGAAVALIVVALAAVGPSPANPQAPGVAKIAFESTRDGDSEIFTMNADGSKPQQLTKNQASDTTPSWAPDGKRIVFASDRDGNWELYLIEVGTLKQSRLTRTSWDEFDPAWSPQGDLIAFESNRAGTWDIFTIRPDGNGARPLTRGRANDLDPAWGPEPTEVSFSSGQGDYDIFVVDAVRPGTPNALTRGAGGDFEPSWSSAGLAFSRRLGRAYDIWVLRTGQSQPRRLTSDTVIDSTPVWAGEDAIVFARLDHGVYEIYDIRPDGARLRNLTKAPRSSDVAPDWTRTGVASSAVRVPASAAGAGSGPFQCKRYNSGTSSSDYICGNGSANTISGLGGNDHIDGKRGTDVLKGDLGNDHLWAKDAEDPRDTLNGGDGTDEAWLDSGKDSAISAVPR